MLLRLIATALFSLLIALASFPDTSRAHTANEPEGAHEHDGAVAPSTPVEISGTLAHSDAARQTEQTTLFEQCHPGLECSTIAAFLMVPTFPVPARAGALYFEFVWRAGEGWMPSFENPPPRGLS